VDRPFLNCTRLVAAGLPSKTDCGELQVRAGEDEMYLAQRCIRIATTFLMFWVISCEVAVAFPQTVPTKESTGASFLLARLPSAPERCARRAESFAIPRGDAEVAGDAPSSCAALPVAMPARKPCEAANRAGTGCEEAKDSVQSDLETMGKAGQKILRAREKVLEILGTENGCSAWFRSKDSNPAATFRTLRYELDLHGEEYIRESRDLGPLALFRNPYVARVVQGDGAYGTITLNPKGAFFAVMARVFEVKREGGPYSMRSTRLLRVGPYDGDTLAAEVVTLLHEFGHVVDILPSDQDNVEGKSVQNTYEVVRNCRGELDSLSKRGTVSAKQ
jgi:hypothetical protein